ncbi:MAG: ABC transporter ATP-binding protein [Candidatus Omnitrophota bacterium]
MKRARELLSILRPHRKKIIFAGISILAVNLTGLAFPWGIKIIIDEVLVKKDFFLLNSLAGALVLIFLIQFYCGFMREYLVSSVGENVVCELRNRLYWHIERLSVKYIEDTPIGKIISGVIGDVESIRNFLFGGLIDFIYSFLNVFFVLIILLFLDWKLTLVSLIFLPAFGLTFFKLTPRLQKKFGAVREKYAELTAHLNEVCIGIRVVCGFGKERYEADRFNSTQSKILKNSMAGHRLTIGLWMGSELVSSLGLVTIIWFGTRAVFSGRITPGTLMAFYSYTGMLFFPVIKMTIINNFYQEAAVAMERIDRILAEEPAVKESLNPVKINKVKGNVIFDGVSFSYDGKREVLSGIDIGVKASQTIALVGKSGAGKTTMINLLLRFYDPDKGGIFIDGYNICDLDLNSYRSSIAMVLQDDYLFNLSVRENILYGKPQASFDEVVRAACLANAHQFITELADGYDTEIGEGGVKLSFGQRQRISISRAIIRDPAILILDEATSCVDSETERLIIEGAYKNVICGRTTFIIAHRLSAITYADRIIFIEGGRIIEEGAHQHLLDKKGRYWKMWTEQTRYSFTSKVPAA